MFYKIDINWGGINLGLGVSTVFKIFFILLLIIFCCYLVYIEQTEGKNNNLNLDNTVFLEKGLNLREIMRNGVVGTTGLIGLYDNYKSILTEKDKNLNLNNDQLNNKLTEKDVDLVNLKKNLDLAVNVNASEVSDSKFQLYNIKFEIANLNAMKLDSLKKEYIEWHNKYKEAKHTLDSTDRNNMEGYKRVIHILNHNDAISEMDRISQEFSSTLKDLKKTEADLIQNFKFDEENIPTSPKLSSEETGVEQGQAQVISLKLGKGEADSGKSGESGSGSPKVYSILDENSEGFTIIKDLCLSLLILNGVIFSCIITIIFSFFGEFLIKRFSLETRFPKIAKIISLRKKFQSYYLKVNIMIILIIASSQILFSIWVLSL